MKMYHARHPFGRSFIIRHVVSRHPVFVAPDITQEHEHETGEIEDELFYRYRAAARGDVNAESGGVVWGGEGSGTEEHNGDKGRRRPDGSPRHKGRARAVSQRRLAQMRNR